MFIKKIRIFATVFLLMAVIIFVPLFSSLLAFATQIFVVALLVCMLLALLGRAWTDAILCGCVAIVLAVSTRLLPVMDPVTRLISLFGLMAFLGLNLVLLIGPWTRFFPKTVWLYKHRRHLGVGVFLTALAHASLIFSTYFSYSPSLTLSYSVPFLGFTALFIMTAMAITSFDKIQKRVSISQWEIIHTFLLVAYALVLAFYFTHVGSELTMHLRLFFVGVLLYWIMISPFALPVHLLRYVDGWKQLHLLVYVAYFSVLIHVWIARVGNEVLSKKIGFVSLTVLVIGSHLIGWVIFFVKRARERMNEKTEERTIDGKLFICVGNSEDFFEGIGRKISLNKKDLAVFRYKGTLYALQNRCPHQGGSLSEGSIKNGYVECPLHGYQFGIKDGKGPAEFGDEVAFYPITETAGKVFVSLS